MTKDRRLIKAELIREMLLASGEKTPTSSIGRIGRMAFAALQSARAFSAGKKREQLGDDEEIDLKKLMGAIASIGRLKGVAMKMGQIMSYIDVAIPDEMRDALSVLQTHAQPMPFDKVRGLIIEELKDKAGSILENMDPTPISAASIGQVHKSILADGTAVAVKVQYPEISEAIEADFRPAAVGTKMASLFYPQARIDDLVKEVRERFLEECDYLHEANSHNRFFEIYKDHPVLEIPAVHPAFCSRRVLTTSFVDGLKFDEFLETKPSQEVKNRIGSALFEFYIGTLFRHRLYNCDPHPGNYLFLKDGRVAMLDHGCTREFETGFVAKLANLTRAVQKDERGSVHQAILGLKMVRDDQPYDYETIRGFLRSFFGPMLKDGEQKVDLSIAMEMREVFNKKKQLMKFSLPGEFVFLFRIRFGLMSVLSTLGARANWFRLEKSYVDDFTKAHILPSH